MVAWVSRRMVIFVSLAVLLMISRASIALINSVLKTV